MKRILAITLALILILSCCPSVYAAAAKSTGYSDAFAKMDPKIKEILDSQISQEERAALVALDPTLADAILLKIRFFRTVFDCVLLSDGNPGNPMEELYSATKEQGLGDAYYVLSSKPRMITLSKDAETGATKISRNGEIGNDWRYIVDLMTLSPQVEINGKSENITDIYCFGQIHNQLDSPHGTTICLMTKAGPQFLFCGGNPLYKLGVGVDTIVLSENEFKGYINDFIWYTKVILEAENTIYNRGFGSFIPAYDYCMKEAELTELTQRTGKIKKAITAHWPVVLGIILVTGAELVAYQVLKKLRNMPLVKEDGTDTADDT